MKRLLLRLLLLAVSTAVFLGLAEWGFRIFGPRPDHGALYYADADFLEVDLNTPDGQARALKVLEQVPDAPRFRMNFKPGVTVHLCYRGMEGRDHFDDHGCVEFVINARGIRDREELCEPKPPGQRRVLCLGDSTTVGWGVPLETTWVRGMERNLRSEDDAIRTVNCGAAGAQCPDEYLHGLQHRFAAFEPDVVLVTLCPNDLLPVNGGMAQFNVEAQKRAMAPVPAWAGWSDFLTRTIRVARRADTLRLPPERDVVAELLALRPDEYPINGPREMGDIYWQSGNPQRSLLGIHAWCQERGIPFGVALWPFLQQLDSREAHPLVELHDLVGTFCEEHEIPYLDLLDVFVGQEPSALWLTPKDMHGNPEAHALTVPAYSAFVRALLADH